MIRAHRPDIGKSKECLGRSDLLGLSRVEPSAYRDIRMWDLKVLMGLAFVKFTLAASFRNALEVSELASRPSRVLISYPTSHQVQALKR